MNQSKADELQERLERMSPSSNWHALIRDAIAALREAQAEIERLNSLGRERDGSESDVGCGHRSGVTKS